MKEWREKLHRRAQRQEMPLKPQLVAETPDTLLAPDAIVLADCGTVTFEPPLPARTNVKQACTWLRHWRAANRTEDASR